MTRPPETARRSAIHYTLKLGTPEFTVDYGGNIGYNINTLNQISSTLQTCTINVNCAYTAISITLTPGTWVVNGYATMYSTSSVDGKLLALYDVTDSIVMSNSQSAVQDATSTTTAQAFNTQTIITTTYPMTIELYGERNGNSIINFGYSNGGLPNTQRLSAYRLSTK